MRGMEKKYKKENMQRNIVDGYKKKYWDIHKRNRENQQT